MTANGHIQISPLGLNETDSMVLEVAVSQLNDEGTDCQLLSINDLKGQLLVIDAESETGKSLYSQAQAGQVKLLFSSEKVSGKNLISMLKPIRVAELKDILAKICERMRVQLATANKTKEAVVEGISSQVDSEEELFYLLFKLKQQKQCIKLGSDNLPDVLINGHDNTVAVHGKAEELSKIIEQPLTNFSITEITRADFEHAVQGMRLMAFDGVLWESAINSSTNNMIEGHDPNKAIKLKAWPNFTRQGFKQEHFKIAAVLARDAVSLKDLETQTGVDHEEIIRFYNACFAVGLIDSDTEALDKQEIKANSPDSETRGLLNRLANRLGIP